MITFSWATTNDFLFFVELMNHLVVKMCIQNIDIQLKYETFEKLWVVIAWESTWLY